MIKKIVIVLISLIVLIFIGILIHDFVVIKSDHSDECCSCCEKGAEMCIQMCCPCSKTILVPYNN